MTESGYAIQVRDMVLKQVLDETWKPCVQDWSADFQDVMMRPIPTSGDGGNGTNITWGFPLNSGQAELILSQGKIIRANFKEPFVGIGADALIQQASQYVNGLLRRTLLDAPSISQRPPIQRLEPELETAIPLLDDLEKAALAASVAKHPWPNRGRVAIVSPRIFASLRHFLKDYGYVLQYAGWEILSDNSIGDSQDWDDHSIYYLHKGGIKGLNYAGKMAINADVRLPDGSRTVEYQFCFGAVITEADQVMVTKQNIT